jgi:hypothetical protein
VRVHTDHAAQASAAALGTRAFASGGHVFLGRGESPADGPLMAHELTHVARHSGLHGKDMVGKDTSEEREANVVEQRVKDSTNKPAWSEAEIKPIQKELIRLGLYRATADGDLGAGTDSALVEAFGGDAWRKMAAADVLTKLKAAAPPAGTAGEHNLRYGEMFKDGILDMTLALGFDEGDPLATDKQANQKRARDNFQAAIGARGFKADKALAIKLYADAGRAIDASAFGEFYVKKDALTYKPPAGDERKVHAIIRLAYSIDGSQGADVAKAYKAGLEQSDIAYYSGHGRYGSGPDFDRNYKFELTDGTGNIEQKIEHYEVLETTLAAEGSKHGRSAWEQFEWRVNNKRINVIASNDGNVVLNTKNPHSDFGGKLMYWNLNRTTGGAKPVTGKGNELASSTAVSKDRKYRVVVFDGCSSVDYATSVRATPGYDEKSADMFGSSRTLDWGDEGPTLATFLDGILKMQSAEKISKDMDSKQSGKAGAYHAYGVDDNPVIK